MKIVDSRPNQVFFIDSTSCVANVFMCCTAMRCISLGVLNRCLLYSLSSTYPAACSGGLQVGGGLV